MEALLARLSSTTSVFGDKLWCQQLAAELQGDPLQHSVYIDHDNFPLAAAVILTHVDRLSHKSKRRDFMSRF